MLDPIDDKAGIRPFPPEVPDENMTAKFKEFEDLAVRDEDNRMMLAFGLGAEMYLKPGDRIPMINSLLDVQEDFYLRFSKQLDKIRFHPKNSKAGSGKTFKLDGANPFPQVREALDGWNPEWMSYGIRMKGRGKRQGRKKFDYHRWSSGFIVSSEQYYEDVESFCFRMPFFTEEDLNCYLLKEVVLDYARRLKPVHGITGDEVDEDGKYAFEWEVR